jgi:hypothetical protein
VLHDLKIHDIFGEEIPLFPIRCPDNICRNITNTPLPPPPYFLTKCIGPIILLDVGLTHLYVGMTHLDVGLTHLDVGLTHLDVGLIHLDVGLIHLDVGLTHLDVGMTHIDMGLTHLDVGLTHLGTVKITGTK